MACRQTSLHVSVSEHMFATTIISVSVRKILARGPGGGRRQGQNSMGQEGFQRRGHAFTCRASLVGSPASHLAFPQRCHWSCSGLLRPVSDVANIARKSSCAAKQHGAITYIMCTIMQVFLRERLLEAKYCPYVCMADNTRSYPPMLM